MRKEPSVRCPNCELVQPDRGTVCPACGVVFANLGKRSGPESAPIASAPEAVLRPQSVSREAWVHLGVGFFVALIVFSVPLLRFAVSVLVVLVHEMGHAAFGWLFGRLSIPAFDFRYGGGVAMIQDQSLPLFLLIYGGAGSLFYFCRHRRPALILLGVCVPLYALCAHTKVNDIIILYMGHGTELVFAGIFLYRALSGRSILHPLERPLYAVCGWFLLMMDVTFAWGLLTDRQALGNYLDGKGGLANDFLRIAGSLGLNVRSVVMFFLLTCVLPPLVAFLIHRYHKRLAHWFHRVVYR